MRPELFWYIVCVFIFKTPVQEVSGVMENIKGVLNFTESAAEHGYRSEEHNVITEDGYILTIFRIPKGKNCQGTVRRPPVLIMHGLLMSSDSWVDSGPTSGLGYLIADGCFDLWLANTRGNYYSRSHVRLNPDSDPEFWQFSLHEVGFYDLPATINYVLSFTRCDKVNYIGYSQGGAVLLMMCSERPSYCDKIPLSILLHPASRMKHTESVFFRLVVKTYQFLQPYLYNSLDLEALPYRGDVQKTTACLCQNYYLANIWCRAVLYLIDSMHRDSISASTIQALTADFPAGTSLKTLLWFDQNLKADDLRNFDYGSIANLRMYGRTDPPAYNISMTKMPVVIIHGRNDKIVSSKDVEWLKVQLPNILELFYVEDLLWNHLDTIFSRHNKKNTYPKISEYLLKYEMETFSSI